MAVTDAQYRQGMRQLAAAVSVITATHAGARNGLTATAVMSVCADPPRLAVAVNKNASALPLLLASGCFAVNVLRYDQDAVATRFSTSKLSAELRFADESWIALDTGAPVLADAAASFDCGIASTQAVGTHQLILGDVRALHVSPSDQPLLFLDGTWASLIQANSAAIAQYGEIVAKSIQAVDQAAARNGSSADKLEEFVRGFTAVNIAHSGITRGFLNHEPYLPPGKLAEINEAKNQFDRKLRQLIEDGMRSGEFDLHDPSLTALAITGMVSWIHRWYREEGRYSPEQIAERLTGMVINMVRARAAHPSSEQEV